MEQILRLLAVKATAPLFDSGGCRDSVGVLPHYLLVCQQMGRADPDDARPETPGDKSDFGPSTADGDSYIDVAAFLSSTNLGLPSWSVGDIERALRSMNMDVVLGYLALVSKRATEVGRGFYDKQHQAEFVRRALESERSKSQSIQVSYADWLKSDSLLPLLHPHNLAWLAHMALLNCEPGPIEPEITSAVMNDVCRLLLAANDHLGSKVKIAPRDDLRGRRELALDLLRRWQFTESFEFQQISAAVARFREIYLVRLQERFDFARVFNDATGGVALRVYFAFVITMLAWVFARQLANRIGKDDHEGMGGHWIPKDSLLDRVEDHRDECETILSWWTIKPRDYLHEHTALLTASPDVAQAFDVVQLKMTPLIELRLGALVAPSISLLFQKALDEPYYFASEMLSEDEAELGSFHAAIGGAYEDYARAIVDELAESCLPQEWLSASQSELRTRAGEIADSLLINEDVAIVFEHKAIRPGMEFLTGSGGDRILGPDLDGLVMLESQPLTPAQLRDFDRGALTKGLNQQSRATERVRQFVEDRLRQPPRMLIPVITHLAPVRVDRLVYELYLSKLCERASYYQSPLWTRPIWIFIEDLELLRDYCAAGTVNLVQLFEAHVAAPTYERFDVFLHRNFQGVARPDTQRFGESLGELINEAAQTLFPRSEAAEARRAGRTG